MQIVFALAVLFLSLAAHADSDVSNFHLQSTIVTQEHGEFASPYSGQNSLSPSAAQETSITWTIFAGRRLWQGSEFYINPELAGGSGFNGTKGIAGFPNGEIYRVDDPSPKWSLARIYLKQVFEFGDAREEIRDDQNQIAGSVAVDRFSITAGRFALNDFFDNNMYSHNPRTQFLNWALMDNGAWDYAADTRGYSWGLFFELNKSDWAVRFASVLVPVQANQMQLDTNYPSARGDNLEFEYRYARELPGAVRALAFFNHANMGNYRATLDTPAFNMNLTQSRTMSEKYGFGVNVEQALTDKIGGFFRASWNDGRNETWAFTEIDQAASLGASFKGTLWNRSQDVAGLAAMINGLSQDHRDYLAAGGYGFIVGDGKLNYAPEEIAEAYYSYRMVPGFDVTGDVQYVLHPAYNADRGPVSAAAVRVHYEI